MKPSSLEMWIAGLPEKHQRIAMEAIKDYKPSTEMVAMQDFVDASTRAMCVILDNQILQSMRAYRG
jgi:hypothetical protein